MRTMTRVYYSPLRAPSTLAPLLPPRPPTPLQPAFSTHTWPYYPPRPFQLPSTPIHSCTAQHRDTRLFKACALYLCVCFVCACLCACARAVGGDDDPGETLVRVSDAAFSSSVDYRTSIITDPQSACCARARLPAPPPPPRLAPHLHRIADDDTRIICQSHEGRKAQ